MTTRKLFDLDAECMLMGWMLVKPNEWASVTEVLAIEDFAYPAAAEVYALLGREGYQTIPQLVARCPDVTAEDLDRWYHLAQFKDPMEIRSHAMRLAELAVCRRVEAAMLEAINDAHDPTLSAAELIVRLRERAFAIELPDALPLDPAPTLRQFLEVKDDGYDWLIPGLIERGERVLVTATGGVGKSTFLRQVAVCAGMGLHPFKIDEGPLPRPLNVLVVDLENSARHVRRKLRQMAAVVHATELDNVRILAHPDVIDVTKPEGWKMLFSYAKEAQPDIIVAGPVYRLYEAGDTARDTGGRDKARQVVNILDQLRDRYNCALLLEAHPPKGSATLSPFGSAVWEWWPDVGLGLQPEDKGSKTVNVLRWRVDRDERDWPKRMRQGRDGEVGWQALELMSNSLPPRNGGSTRPLPEEDF